MNNSENLVSGVVFLNKIDTVLKEQNRTRKSFCESLGILQGTMATWKTKDIMPPIHTIILIAKELEVSVDWICTNESDFEESRYYLGDQSRWAIRKRIYNALGEKYKDEDNRFNCDFLSDESLLEELHKYYFNPGYVSYRTLYNWSNGRCEIEPYIFNQWATSLNTTLQYLLTNSELLIPSDEGYSKEFDKDLYSLALKYRTKLYTLNSLTESRSNTANDILNQLMRLQHLENVVKNNNT